MKLRYKGLVNKNIAERRSLVKRLNQRLTQIEKTFGKDSQTYQNIIAPLQTDRFSDFIGTTKGTGHLKLKVNVGRDWKNEDVLELVRIAQGSFVKTSSLMNRAERWLKAEYGDDYKPTRREIIKEVNRGKEFSAAMADFKEYMYDEYTIKEREEKFPELYRSQNGTKPSYETIEKVLRKEAEKSDRWRKRFKRYKQRARA